MKAQFTAFVLLLSIPAVLTNPLLAADAGPGKPDSKGERKTEELKTVKARSIELRVPASWKPVKTTSQFRAAQFEIPAVKEGQESAELVVYYFGGPTGGIKANIERWVGQFREEGRKEKLTRGKSKLGEFILSDVSGTWKKPDGPPFAQKTVDKPDSRVLGLILITAEDGEKDYYFLKLGGPDALVSAQAEVLRAAIGAVAGSEKPFQLKDAEN